MEERLAPAGDDDLVAGLVQGLGQRPADAGAAAGDEDGVAADVHRKSLSWLRDISWRRYSLMVRRLPKVRYAPKGECRNARDPRGDGGDAQAQRGDPAG